MMVRASRGGIGNAALNGLYLDNDVTHLFLWGIGARIKHHKQTIRSREKFYMLVKVCHKGMACPWIECMMIFKGDRVDWTWGAGYYTPVLDENTHKVNNIAAENQRRLVFTMVVYRTEATTIFNGTHTHTSCMYNC